MAKFYSGMFFGPMIEDILRGNWLKAAIGCLIAVALWQYGTCPYCKQNEGDS
jgi:hypothetical protein